MLGWLTGQDSAERTAGELYGRVVAAARNPRLYRAFGVPDTPEGRFEMVALHLFLAVETMRRSGGDDAEAQRLTIERFVTDMDDCMREMGVGDLTVPKKVRRAAAGFYDRAGAYRSALASDGDGELQAALARNIWEGATDGAGDAVGLASYVRGASAALAGRGPREIFTEIAGAT